MRFDIPKRNLQEKNSECENDPELAHILALHENVARGEVQAYSQFLKNPESFSGEDYARFKRYQDEKVSEQEIMGLTMEAGEEMADFYLSEKRIVELKKSGKKTELLKIAIINGLRLVKAFISTGFGLTEKWSRFQSAVQEKRKHMNGLMLNPQRTVSAASKSGRSYKLMEETGGLTRAFFEHVNAVHALFWKPKKEQAYAKDVQYYANLREEAERYYGYAKKMEFADLEDSQMLSDNGGPSDEAMGNADPEGRGGEDRRVAEEDVIGDSFALEEKAYQEYLGGKKFSFKIVNEFFAKMKSKGVKPEDIQNDRDFWKEAVKEMVDWNSRVFRFGEKELMSERIDNFRKFLAIALGVKKYKKGQELDFMKDYSASLYKFFRTINMQAGTAGSGKNSRS